MPRPPSQHPTDLELEILKVLWRLGPSPVRRVREALAAGAGALHEPRELAYTTVMTVMTIMTQKGYLRRTRSDTGYIYHAKARRDLTTGRMLRDLVDRAFSGSAGAAVVNLLESSEIPPEELRRLRELIDRMERQQAPTNPDSDPPKEQTA